ncbi:MAG: hypothetical protein COA42_01425 [Alteromonadaceae bacterium]|nr:MAG: hypothetical protein COA42_01425 [Alteromonadaceae bacterium]
MPTLAANQCSTISCDCSKLPTQSWQETCRNQENRLVANCVKNNNASIGYCSLHGPQANALPLATNITQVAPATQAQFTELNHKAALIYWSMINDFDYFKRHIEKRRFIAARGALELIDKNSDTLYTLQQKLSSGLAAEDKNALSQQSWRDYSQDALGAATDLYNYSEYLLNTYDTLDNEQQRNRMRDVGIQLMATAGKVYEQAGLAYGNGMRHKHAAQAWKNASQASALILSHSTEKTNQSKQNEYYRYQSASRLHRASYHWAIGEGKGAAGESLVEAQKFMGNGGSAISGIVREEEAIRASQPYWRK